MNAEKLATTTNRMLKLAKRILTAEEGDDDTALLAAERLAELVLENTTEAAHPELRAVAQGIADAGEDDDDVTLLSVERLAHLVRANFTRK